MSQNSDRNESSLHATNYWSEQLPSSGSTTRLAIKRLGHAYGRGRRIECFHELPGELAKWLRELSVDHPERLTALTQLVWALLLCRYSLEDEVSFGFVFPDGTPEPGLAQRVEPIRVGLPPEGTLAELLAEQRRAVDEQLQNLHNASGPDGDRAFGQTRIETIAAWCGQEHYPPFVGANTDLSWQLLVSDGSRLCVSADGNIGENAVERLLGHLQNLLSAFCHASDQSFREVGILSSEEYEQIVRRWNDTSQPYPDECLHRLFEQRVVAQADRPAVVSGETVLSYAELNVRANRLAHRLIELGVGVGDRVGLCIERSVEMVVGLLGVLKAGACYVPLDPNYPAERLDYLVKDSDAAALVTSRRLAATLPTRAPCVHLGPDGDELSDQPESNPEVPVTPRDLAYVIYTSGSTGKPKAAILNHRGRVNNFADFNRRYRIGPDDSLLAVSSLSFDMTAYDVFGTLMAGGRVVVVPDDERLEPTRWATLVERYRVTVWHSVPALAQMLVDVTEKRPDLTVSSLRLVLLGGDWIPLALPGRLSRQSPEVAVVSMGGATEVSMDSTIFDINDVDPTWKSIPYGRPMANQLAYVLDRYLQPVPVGVAGELHLGGDGVGEGYRNRPELTREKFIPNPFVDRDGARMYKTGDLVRFDSEGQLELLGRMDFQVKIRGYRIELGEVESAVRGHRLVEECVVIARPHPRGDHRLIAYVLAESPSKPGRGTAERSSLENIGSILRRHLAEILPDYMVPSAFVLLSEFPLTPNGKINRKALPDPGTTRPDLESEFVAPRGPVEMVVARIWADALGVAPVGARDRFVPLGGSSLLATEVVAALREVFPSAVTVKDVFSLTVSRLAESLESGVGAADLAAIATVYLEVIDGDSAMHESSTAK